MHPTADAYTFGRFFRNAITCVTPEYDWLEAYQINRSAFSKWHFDNLLEHWLFRLNDRTNTRCIRFCWMVTMNKGNFYSYRNVLIYELHNNRTQSDLFGWVMFTLEASRLDILLLNCSCIVSDEKRNISNLTSFSMLIADLWPKSTFILTWKPDLFSNCSDLKSLYIFKNSIFMQGKQ